MRPDYVLVTLRCTTRPAQPPVELCVKVERGVPDEIRCTPSGGAAGNVGGPSCPRCAELLAGRINEVVNDLTRRGWAEHVKAGSVIVEC